MTFYYIAKLKWYHKLKTGIIILHNNSIEISTEINKYMILLNEQRWKFRDYNEKINSTKRGLLIYFKIWSNDISCFENVKEKDAFNKLTSLQC